MTYIYHQQQYATCQSAGIQVRWNSEWYWLAM